MLHKKHNRRDFLKLSLGAALGSSSLFGMSASLQTLHAATLQSRMSDYKALVCIFLKGGNDSMNMVVPMDTAEYAVYSNSRGNLAIPHSSLIPLGNTGYGMNPDSAGLAQLFQQNKMSVIANLGTLIEPTTKAAVNSGAVQLPPQLFSHNDQQRLWMNGDSQGEINTGWAGRIADLLEAGGVSVFPSMNLFYGSLDLMQLGVSSQAYGLQNDGVAMLESAINILQGTRVHGRYLDHFDFGIQHAHPMVREYARKQKNSFDIGSALSNALANAPSLSTTFTTFPGKSLASQLETTARLIAINQQLGTQRQVFFITTGSWDTHAGQNDVHSFLQQELSTNLREFQNELEFLGVADKVTTFTATEFGRTLGINGDGTDHGWGGHSFVLGANVDGGKIFGQMPDLQINGPDDLGRGRIIPTNATDQYTATLARWFGLEEAEINTLFPRLSNFNSSDLGFMLTV